MSLKYRSKVHELIKNLSRLNDASSGEKETAVEAMEYFAREWREEVEDKGNLTEDLGDTGER
jgi:hypothetical protein